MDAVTARDEAIRRVDVNADSDWKDEAYRVVAALAAHRPRFTTDDVWGRLSGVGTHEPRAMGAIMRQAARDGLIRATSEYQQSGRVACHARPLRVWESLRVIPTQGTLDGVG